MKKSVGESGQRFSFVTNLYRAWGWTLVSVLGQKVPTTRFRPADYRKEQDVVAARAATDLAPLIERWNRMPLLNLRIAYLMYTHGICGIYTRHLVDGERFGHRMVDKTEMQPLKISEDRYECSTCFNEVPLEQAILRSCPNCGNELADTDYVPGVTVEVPQVTGTVKTPKGQQLMSVHTGLEMRLPPWVDKLEDCVYLGLLNESHKSQLLHTYGKRAEGLEGTSSGTSSGDYDRFARLVLTEPQHTYYSIGNKNLITLRRFWLRPAAFTMVKGKGMDEKGQEFEYAAKLKELFPDGAYIAYGNDERLLDARNEGMGDHWELVHAHEGPGMYKPALGSSAISINKRQNILENFIMEWVEYSAAGQGTLINSAFLNINALAGQRRTSGVLYPVKAPVNVPLGNLIHESRPGAIPSEIFGQGERLIKLGEKVTGATPSVSGGTEISLKPTTFLADREQALGKLFGPWLHIRTALANIMAKSVRDWAKNEADDEAYTASGQNGEYDGKEILIDDLAGEIEAFPETSEAFPETWSQQSALFLKFMEMATQDEQVGEIIGHPKNLAFGKDMLGLPKLFIPGEDDRIKQEIEIRQLLQGQPTVLDTPEGGQIISPSVPIGEFEDAHLEHIQAVKEWAVSSDGLRAKRENPMGYVNCLAHGRAHEEYLEKKALQQAQMVAMAQATPSAEATPQKAEKP